MRLAWNWNQLSLVCCKEEAGLILGSPGCYKISFHNEERWYLLPGTFPSSSLPADWGFLLQKRQFQTFVAPGHLVVPDQQWYMSGKSAQNTVFWFAWKHPFFFSVRNLKWSYIWCRVPTGTLCGVWLLHTKSRAAFPRNVSRLWRRVWSIVKPGAMLSIC